MSCTIESYKRSRGNCNFFRILLDFACTTVIIHENAWSMLHFQIDAHAGMPVYRQILDQIKYYVASGILKPGDRLPSIRELAQTLAVNPTTVVRVYGDLEHEGLIEMQHGRGAFVTARSFR